MGDWEEIKRLAADFQRTQTSDTLQKISERNCIDIVKKLTELNLIELIYTCDGKEYITPAHLRREIEDEVYMNGGRRHFNELASSLNVDFQHIENEGKLLARDKPEEYNLIQGQIIHTSYKETLRKQINDTLMETGSLSISDFAKTLDLPSEFLIEIISSVIASDDSVVSPDGRTYYTSDMMDRYKSIVAGTLTAITKPTTTASIMKKIDIPERLFNPIVDELIKSGRIDATIENRQYIPSIYAREQNEWIDGFYRANSFIEYDVLTRKDIKQPKAFLKKRFPEGIQLKTCFIGPALVSQTESLVEDCIASNSLIDISTILPPAIQPEDIEQLIRDLFRDNAQFQLINQVNVCSLGYIESCKKAFNQMMQSRADEDLKQGKLINYFLGGHQKTPQKRNNQDLGQAGKDTSQSKPEIGGDGGNEDSQAQSVSSPKESDKSSKLDKSDKFIEMTPEDLKREKRNRKSKGGASTAEVSLDQFDSDDDQGNKKSKSRKSGGGAQGREIKQKSTKKKYLAGKKKNDDDSDEEPTTTKTPKSTKGRAARRAEPEPEKPPTKEPLIFMTADDIARNLKTRDLGEFSDELAQTIATQIESDLNIKYKNLAKRTLDEYLEKQAEMDDDCDNPEIVN